MIKKIAAGIAALGAALSSAQAQNQLFADNTISAISPEEVAQIFIDFGYAATVQTVENNDPIIEVMQTGGRFYVSMRQCNEGECQLVQPYGLFNGQGVTLNQLNAINLNKLNVANTMLLDNGAGIIADKFYLQSGTTVENLKFNLGLFTQDLNIVVNAIQPGAVATISFPRKNKNTQEPGFPESLLKNATINAIGVEAPNFMTPALAKHLN